MTIYRANPVVTSCISYSRIKIYVRGILHISIPKDSNAKLQSWLESDKNYIIELFCAGESDRYEYDNKEMWEAVLKELDLHLY